MKKNIILLVFLAFFLSACQTKFFPTPKEPKVCDSTCMQSYIDLGDIEGFLQNYNPDLATPSQKELFSRFGGDSFAGKFTIVGEAKIAVLIPHKVIKSFSVTIANSILAYVINQNLNVNVRFFYTGDETAEAIEKSISQIRAQGYELVIAAVTDVGLSELEKHSDLVFFVPTLSGGSYSSNIIFGGIDYNEQIDALLEIAGHKIVIFSDGSKLTELLNSYISQKGNVTYSQLVTKKVNFGEMFKDNRDINGTSVFLNTPLIVSSLLASQIRTYDLDPINLLSTQINYNNALFSITQPENLEKLYIANSIPEFDPKISAYGDLFELNLEYDWVAYASMVGVEYLYSKYFGNIKQLFEHDIKANKIIYKTRIMRADKHGFYLSED